MVEKTKAEEKRDHLKVMMSLLFSKYIEHEPSEDIESIGEYFSFLAENIDHKHARISVDKELVQEFEAVCLLLKDRLAIYPESVRNQVSEILGKAQLSKLFGAINTLDEKDFQHMVRSSDIGANSITGIILRLFGSISPSLSREFGIDRGHLLQSKILLNRLAQILRFASTIELLDYDTSQSELKDHYDPNLIDKDKVLALIGVMRVQLKQISDTAIQERVTERLDALEEEVKRKKPRWGRVIATCFFLFGFFADLKTISPNTYNAIYTTVEKVIYVIHTDGLVQTQRKLLTSDAQSEGRHNEIDTHRLPDMGLPPKMPKVESEDERE